MSNKEKHITELMIVGSHEDLALALDVTGFEAVRKAVFKSTKCGAFVEKLNGCPNTGVAVGSIVEGVEWQTETHELKYPFHINKFWAALKAVEEEADDIWQSTHGCEACGDPDEYNGGYIAINPSCTSCKGDGIII